MIHTAGCAQRRPGREPRRHWLPALINVLARIAQRRPGREPRRHLAALGVAGADARRSTKAGARTPATLPALAHQGLDLGGRSTKAGARTPATRLRSTCTHLRSPPLNEGRGANPGDTCVAEVATQMNDIAQRRPGREPRRHRGRGRYGGGFSGRSTKAGARTPATLTVDQIPAHDHTAQRRPGREPRRHVRARISVGAAAAAQRRPGREPRRHPVFLEEAVHVAHAQRRPGREPRRHFVRIGPSVVISIAQRRPGREPRRHLRRFLYRTYFTALNEGRGANPGDTRPPPPRRPAPTTLNEGRGANPGDTPPIRTMVMQPSGAQRRPGREPRRHPLALTAHSPCPVALNEGRGANPGDTLVHAMVAGGRQPLNEGRGANPGDTSRRLTRARRLVRSTKAGARTPATPTC